MTSKLWRLLWRASDALRAGAGIARLALLSAAGWGPKLPPGSLGPLSIAGLRDHRFYWRRHQRYGPIFKVLWNRQLTICVVGFERARRLFAVHAQALLPMTIDIASFVPHGFMRSMAREPHAKYRGLFTTALRGDPTQAWEHEIRALIREQLDDLARPVAPESSARASALTPTLDRIATRALIVLFFGQRLDDALFRRLEEAFRRMGPEQFVYPLGPEQRRAFDDIRATIDQLVPAFRSAPTASPDSVLGRLAADPSGVDATSIGNLIYMVEMGRYDVRSLMRWVLRYLSDTPDEAAELRRLSTTGNAAERINRAEMIVLETLRLDQAEALNRAVTSDIVFEGYTIPKGSALRVLLRESHQAAETFANPTQFAPCRFADRSYSSVAYAPFGIGEHRCIAAQMVVRLATLLVDEIALGYTWSVSGDGRRYRGHFHWEPAPSFDLALTARDRNT